MKLTTLEQAKQFLRDNFKKKAVVCPCCNQNVKLYKRKLNAGMAYAIIIMYRLHKQVGFETYLKMNEEISKLGIPSSNLEYMKLAYWDLVQEQPNDDTKKKTSGYWRLNWNGQRFAEKLIRVPKYCYVYNGKVRGRSNDEMTSLEEALGDKFDYEELMKGFI